LEKGRETFLERCATFERELEEQIYELDEFLKFILKCNEPTILARGQFDRWASLPPASTSIRRAAPPFALGAGAAVAVDFTG